jgi:hypothetical protein
MRGANLRQSQQEHQSFQVYNDPLVPGCSLEREGSSSCCGICVFSQTPATLLLVGGGKTSFVCQIVRWGLGLVDEVSTNAHALCKHPMLPVLIEQELGEIPES